MGQPGPERERERGRKTHQVAAAGAVPVERLAVARLLKAEQAPAEPSFARLEPPWIQHAHVDPAVPRALEVSLPVACRCRVGLVVEQVLVEPGFVRRWDALLVLLLSRRVEEQVCRRPPVPVLLTHVPRDGEEPLEQRDDALSRGKEGKALSIARMTSQRVQAAECERGRTSRGPTELGRPVVQLSGICRSNEPRSPM